MDRLPHTLRRDLERHLGPEHVVTDPSITAGVATDWTGRYVGATPALLRPGDVDQVSAILALLAEAGVPVVPQGGNTGLVGGSVPLDGEVVVSLTRLDHIGEPDPTVRQVTVGAGATLAGVDAAARRVGLRFGVQIASWASATVGGAIATNAGGSRVVAHGSMRDQLAGATAVRSDGTVLSHLGGLAKDNTGPRWELTLAGSEGTLAVVTDARLTLRTVPIEAVVVLAGVGGADDAVALAARLSGELAGVEAIEFMTASGLALTCERLGLSSPFDPLPPFVVLVEVTGGRDTVERTATALAELTDTDTDVAVGTDEADRRRLWAYRERHTEAIATVGIALKCDVATPLSRWASFVAEVERLVASRGGTSVLFGHLAEGNVHVNILGIDADASRVEREVFELVAAHDGSISAEHGIGRMKAPHWLLNRSESELALFAELRRAWDPAGILNPGVQRTAAAL